MNDEVKKAVREAIAAIDEETLLNLSADDIALAGAKAALSVRAGSSPDIAQTIAELAEALINDARSICEPEEADDTAAEYTKRVMGDKFKKRLRSAFTALEADKERLSKERNEARGQPCPDTMPCERLTNMARAHSEAVARLRSAEEAYAIDYHAHNLLKLKFGELESERDTLAAEVARLREALTDVVNPLGRMRRMAAAQGAQLSEVAYAIANDIHYVQDIARAALLPSDAEKNDA